MEPELKPLWGVMRQDRTVALVTETEEDALAYATDWAKSGSGNYCVMKMTPHILIRNDVKIVRRNIKEGND